MAKFEKSTSKEIEKVMLVLVWILVLGLPVTFVIEYLLRVNFPAETDELFHTVFGIPDLLTYGVGLGLLFMAVMHRMKPENRRINKMDGLMLFWLLSLILSIIGAANKEMAIVGIDWTREGALVILIYSLLYYAVAVQKEKGRKSIVILLCIACLIQILAAVVQSCFKTSLFENYFTTIKMTHYSAMGFMYNQNALGSFMALMGGAFLGAFLFSKEGKNKYLWWGMMVLSFLALLLSGTRGGILGVVGGTFIICPVYCVYNAKHGVKGRCIKNIIMIVAGMVLAFLVALFTSEAVQYMFWRISNDGKVLSDTSSSIDQLGSSRIMIWKEAWKIFTEHPIIGKGVSNFRFYKIDIKVINKEFYTYTYDSYVAHNMYLELLANQGIVGLAAWVSLLAGHLFGAVCFIKNSQIPKEITWIAASACGIFAFMITDIVEWHIIYLTPFVYILLGLMMPRKEEITVTEKSGESEEKHEV